MIYKNSVEKLIFGDKYASSINNPNFLATQLSKIVPSLQYVDTYDKKYDFLGKSYTVNLNGLKICANYMSPTRISASNSDEYTLMIPLKGNCTTTVENKDFFWGEDSFAYCKPKCEGKSISEQNRNLILFDLSPKRFNQQAKIMLGKKYKESFFNFENPNLVPLKYNSISFDLIIKQLCKIIDENIDSLQKLEKTRFDEVIYRTLVMMFLPEKFFEENLNSRKPKISTSTLNLVKELEHENYFSFMTLSDLEKFFDLSTRNLQLIFKKHFEITPTQFLREQKLKYAKKLILDSHGTLNVTNIAIETGFVNFSQFAKYYKEFHGVLPSQTIKKLKS